MLLKNFIIYIFTISLLSSNVTWAGNGMVDSMLDSFTQQTTTNTFPNFIPNDDNTDLYTSQHHNVMHHLVDKHHNDHDCHMSAHLIGLNSNTIIFTHHSLAQEYAALDIQFSTHQISPPSKPPRA